MLSNDAVSCSERILSQTEHHQNIDPEYWKSAIKTYDFNLALDQNDNVE